MDITNSLDVPEQVAIEAEDNDSFTAYQTAVSKWLDKLQGMGNYDKRRATVWHLAWANVTPQMSQAAVFRMTSTVSKKIYVQKWSKQIEFMAVLTAVQLLTRSYVENKDARRLDREREALKKRELEISGQLLDKVKLMLEFPLVTAVSKDEIVITEDGEVTQNVTVLEPSGWRMRDAAYLLKEGSTIARRALSMVKDTSAVVDAEPLDLSQMSDEELDELDDSLL